ncbi:sodium-independent sulfate anion transporter-like [Amphiura filiformis]|uniref:sodium-independent sulfate anion transporter-like n=1 Tax=Amphiura filiformis TaxID=82378 RepID=UPI003B224230
MESVQNVISSYCSMDSWKRRVPILNWLPKYQLNYTVSDAIAGLTVGMTIIPQGLAYASIAKLSIEYGLYSAFMGSFMYFFLGTSKDVSVGPTAIVSLLVATYGKSLGDGSGLNDPSYAVTLAFFCGLVQFLLGALHLGSLTGFISNAVIMGFTFASVITIGFGQVKNVLGISFDSSGFIDDLRYTFQYITDTNPWDLLLGVGCMIALLLLEHLKSSSTEWEKEDYVPTMPQNGIWKFLWFVGTARNAIIVLLTGLIAWSLDEGGLSEYITITGEVTEGLPKPKVPDFTAPDLLEVLSIAIGFVPLIAFLETIAVGKSFGRQNSYKVDSNQELIALGVGNLAGSFFQAYPTGGAFSRSAIQSQSGAKTPAAGVVCGAVVLIALAFVTPAFYFIPKAALAAVIIMALVRMINIQSIVNLWIIRRVDLVPFAVTFILSLIMGVEYGTLIGVGVDLIILLYPMARPGMDVINPSVTESSKYDEERPETEEEKKSYSGGTPTVVVKVDRSMRYPASDYIVDKLTEIREAREYARHVVVDFTCVTGIDSTMVEVGGNRIHPCVFVCLFVCLFVLISYLIIL